MKELSALIKWDALLRQVALRSFEEPIRHNRVKSALNDRDARLAQLMFDSCKGFLGFTRFHEFRFALPS
jgi:hypothetical protein